MDHSWQDGQGHGRCHGSRRCPRGQGRCHDGGERGRGWEKKLQRAQSSNALFLVLVVVLVLVLVLSPTPYTPSLLAQHVAKNGSHKILDSCNLPLTGKGVVDLVITDMCVFKVDKENGRLKLIEVRKNEARRSGMKKDLMPNVLIRFPPPDCKGSDGRRHQGQHWLLL